MRSVLKSSRLRRILAAYTVNRLGTWFGFVALSVAVFDHTHSAIAVAGLLICGQVLPALAAPALIARVEASQRRGVMSALYLAEAVLTVALAALIGNFWLPAVLALVALDGTAMLAASALLRAAAARAAHEDFTAGGTGDVFDDQPNEPSARHDAERSANAALNIAFSATFVLGPAIAGVVVAGAGGSTALLIDAASFLLCGAMLGDQRAHVSETEDESSVGARLKAAWQHINGVRALRALLLTEALALVFFEFSGPIEVAYAKATLHAGDSGYGLLLGSWGVGVVAGSIFFARSSHRHVGTLLSAGTLGVGVAYLGFSVAPSLALACIAALCGGVGNGIQWASLISAVQRLTPARLHGRLMGAIESLGSLCPAVGLSLGGVLVAISSPRDAFLVAGIGASFSTVLFVRLFHSGLELAPERENDAPATPVVGHGGSLSASEISSLTQTANPQNPPRTGPPVSPTP